MISLEEKCFKISGLINSSRTMWYLTGLLRKLAMTIHTAVIEEERRNNPVKCSTLYHITPSFASPARAKMRTSPRRGKPVLRISSLPRLWTGLCTRISSLLHLWTRLRTRISSLPRLGKWLCMRISSHPHLWTGLCTRISSHPHLWTRLCTRISSLLHLWTGLRTRISSLPRLGTGLYTYFVLSPFGEAILQQKRNFHTTGTAVTCQYLHLIQNRDD